MAEEKQTAACANVTELLPAYLGGGLEALLHRVGHVEVSEIPVMDEQQVIHHAA